MPPDQLTSPYVHEHVYICFHLSRRSVKNSESIRKSGLDENSVCKCAMPCPENPLNIIHSAKTTCIDFAGRAERDSVVFPGVRSTRQGSYGR